MKNKAFKNLIKEAESKKLLSFQDVKQFFDNDKKINSWIEKIRPIFYSEKHKEKQENNQIISFPEFLQLYEEGSKFNLINEECDDLLNKCKELKNLFDEIKISLNNNNINNNILDFAKLKSFEEKIILYNLSCDEFDLVLNQLNHGKKWLEAAKKFTEEYNKSIKNKFRLHYMPKKNTSSIDITTFIQNRNDNIKSIEKYLKENKIFYNDLKSLTENIPSYFKNSAESTELLKYQCLSEVKMNNPIKSKNTEDILQFIENFQGHCIPKETMINYFNSYRIKTWNQAIKLKLDLTQAESLLKESEILKNFDINDIIDEKIEENDIIILRNKINIMKEWINKTKNFLMKKEKTISELNNKINEIKELPLLSGTIDELINFKNIIEQNINEIKQIKKEKTDFNTIIKLYKTFNNHKFIDCPEQTYIKYLYDFGIKWTENAKKIINSRQLCQLYFKNKVPKKDGTFVEDSQNLIDILSGQSNENTLIEPKFAIDEKINEKNNNKENNIFLNKKRNNNDNYNDINIKEDKEKNINIINKEINSGNNLKDLKDENNYSMDIDEEMEEKDINENNNTNNENQNENIFDLFEENIEYNPSEKVKKYYLNQPLQKYEAANLLSLINSSFNLNQNTIQANQIRNPNAKQSHFTRSSNNNQISPIESKNPDYLNKNINREENISPEQIQRFISMDYYQRYMFLKSHLIFYDDTGEQYCICRKGDDSINYMISCEICKEWFHGKCLGMPKPVADNISNYYCLCCSKKYDLPKENYHKHFYEIKRVSLNELVLMIEEGKKANCIFEEMEILEDIKLRSEIWNKKFYKLLDKIVQIYKTNDFLDSETERNLEILYLESEAIQLNLSSFSHVINILKHNKWFKDVNKELSSNKQNEENISKLLKSAYWIFNINEKNFEIPKMENNYYEIIYQMLEMKIGILEEIYYIFKQNGGKDNSPLTKDKNKKK